MCFFQTLHKTNCWVLLFFYSPFRFYRKKFEGTLFWEFPLLLSFEFLGEIWAPTPREPWLYHAASKSILPCQRLWPPGLCVPFSPRSLPFPAQRNLGPISSQTFPTHGFTSDLKGAHGQSYRLSPTLSLPSQAMSWLTFPEPEFPYIFPTLSGMARAGFRSPGDQMAGDTPGLATFSSKPEHCSQIPVWLHDLNQTILGP